MRKKGRAVPEWLNSPIWSATPPAPAPPDPYGVDLAPPPPLKPPPPAVAPPVPPPPSYEQAVGAGGGRGDEEDEGAGAVIRAQLLSDFKAALSKKVVNMGELRRLACLGVPDGGGGVRPVVWKLLLGYLPTDRSLWAYELEKKRSQYSAYKEEFLLNPVQNVKLIHDQNSGQLQGYGFVEFTSRAAAERVLQTYNGQMMPNVELTFRGQAAGPGHARRRQTSTRVRLLFPASPQGWPRRRLASRLVGNGRRLPVLL